MPDHHVLVEASDSDSDEPIVLDAPPPRVASSSTSRSRSSSIRPPASHAPDAGPSRPRKRKSGGTTKAPSQTEVDEDDDDVVFVGQTKARELASRFSFQAEASSSTRIGMKRSTTTITATSSFSATASSATASGSSSTSSTLPTPFYTLSSAALKPLPVPEWLPKTAILNELRKCVLCQRDFKKIESGAARWRHLSTCLPPAFRAPNPPPDLEALISIALEGPTEDSTLLRRRTNAAAASDHLMTNLADIVPRPRRTLRNTTVRASNSREGWSEEVDQRVVEVVGETSPVLTSRYFSRSSRSCSPEATLQSLLRLRSRSFSRSPSPPATQPLGESSLSAEFSRPESPARSPSPDNLLPQAPPLIGLSQAVRDDFAREEATQSRRAEFALSQAHEQGFTEVDSSPFRGGAARNPQGAAPVTPRASTSTRNGGGGSRRLSALESRRHVSGDARPSPRGWDSSSPSKSSPHTPSSALGRLGISSPNRGSPTPKAGRVEVIDLCFSSGEESSPPREASPVDYNEWDYGGGPDLEFDPGPDWEYSSPPPDSPPAPPEDDLESADGSAPSVSRSDAGLEVSDTDWGGDAVLVWDGEGYSDDEVAVTGVAENDEDDDEEDDDEEDDDEEDDAVDDDDEVGEDDYEVHDIDVSDDDAPTSLNKMPDYGNWDIPKLQRLVKGYGYRPAKDRKALVKIATDCWTALHPASTPKAKAKSTRGQGKTKAKPVRQNPAKTNDIGDDGGAGDVGPATDLYGLFRDMLVTDDALYARILRYEPLSFDELVSRAIAAGVTGTGWRPKLKRFLDLKGVTYFTGDPTAARRRY